MGGPEGQGGHLGDPLGPWVGLMSLLMIHEAYMPAFKVIQIFLTDKCTYGRTEVLHEVPADLKIKVCESVF